MVGSRLLRFKIRLDSIGSVMKIGLLVLVLSLLALVGCDSSNITPPPTTARAIPTPTVVNIASESEKEKEIRLVNNNWISPAEVNIGNYYSGAKASWRIKIHNGNDIWTKFLITYLAPSGTREGYAIPPEGIESWVIISDSAPMLQPKETKEILVTLAIPEDIIVNDAKWEFWTVVSEQGQGMVQIQQATRWFVSMR
jgi:hypothetical protein